MQDAGGTEDAAPLEDAGPPDPLVFAGIASAAWDGADGLAGTWPVAGSPFEIAYTLEARSLADDAVTTADTADLTAAVTGLADGEYRLRTIATDTGGRESDGGRSIVQLVGANRLVHRSTVPRIGAASVWGEDDIVVLAGWESGLSFSVVDTTDVRNPIVLTDVAGEGYVKEAKIADGMLFTIGECDCLMGDSDWFDYDQIGVRIYDFADPANPALLGTVGAPSGSVHNVWYDAGYLYLTDNANYAVAIWDATDPANPSFVRHWAPPPGAFIHDQIVLDDLMYVAYWHGFAIVDVSDPANPVDVVVHSYGPAADAACHNVWPTEDRRYVFTTDELAWAGHLRVWDVSDPEAVTQVAEWWTDPTHTIHNVHVRGDYAYISYYWDGVVVLDVSDPVNPVLVGSYDTYDEAVLGAGSPWTGAWGVWPYGPHVAVGDTHAGLLLFDHFPEVVE